ncbi:MAG: hypothetical protein DRJ98_06280 [Thermoprotei archaeon]|nr:MAG: hypothetical protein DRJ98_06280 [Thermoprotei archaeon]RLF18178.1 MAG: hypothetical protein DRN06_02190 [Thermoprotei archaeon]
MLISDREIILKGEGHEVHFQNDAILNVKKIKAPKEMKGLSIITISYPSFEKLGEVKLWLMGPSALISAIYTVLREYKPSFYEPDQIDLKLLLLFKAGIQDLRLASLILEEDLSKLFSRVAFLARSGFLSK